MKRLTLSFVLLIAGLLAVIPAAAQDTYEARDLEIDLGGFISQAEFTYPSKGDAPYPTIILFHGSGPYDRDATYTTTGGEPISTNFRRIAERLAENGIAVLRFNKRGVLENGGYDYAEVQASTLDRLVEDANAVIDAALEQPEVDSDALYLYGWSEGAWVAANAAAQREEVDGLILQGAPDDRLDTILPYQHLDIGMTYLSEVTDADEDGKLSLEELATLQIGSVALMPAFYMYAYTSTLENPQLNPFTNTDGDDLIDLEGELRPAIETFLKNYQAFAPKVESSYRTAELITEIGKPVLLLHGENDGWVPVSSAEAIAETAPELVTLNIYEGLGHALSESDVPAEDTFNVMADEPLEDLIAWINER
jgi:uncharacterized protein